MEHERELEDAQEQRDEYDEHQDEVDNGRPVLTLLSPSAPG
jgi:hypothetical protein